MRGVWRRKGCVLTNVWITSGIAASVGRLGVLEQDLGNVQQTRDGQSKSGTISSQPRDCSKAIRPISCMHKSIHQVSISTK
jgi:hypothetical protein